jgi:hypothetical protein
MRVSITVSGPSGKPPRLARPDGLAGLAPRHDLSVIRCGGFGLARRFRLSYASAEQELREADTCFAKGRQESS